jgi:hypothetical protein
VWQLRKEKEAFYQLYQIEKTKSERACQFISSFLAQIAVKYPHLAKDLEPAILPAERKRLNEEKRQKKEAAVIQHLELANRSLHRQVEEYRAANDKLKAQLSSREAPLRNTLLLPGGLFEPLLSKSTLRSKGSSIQPSKSELQQLSPLADLDLR